MRKVIIICIALAVVYYGWRFIYGMEILVNDAKHEAMPLSDSLSPYKGPLRPVNNVSIFNKIMAGYQGWFTASGDGYGAGFVHWGGMDKFIKRCTVDFWPDMSELDEDEKFSTRYKHEDGTTATVFSSTVKKTVLRHFKWMRDYGVDGVWVQRFVNQVRRHDSWRYKRVCAVLNNCREGANTYGRAYAVMYDTDFDKAAVNAMMADWTRLRQEMKITETPAYLQHKGAPVVSFWGYGFSHRKFDPKEAEKLFRFFKRPENGGCTIKLGVPNDWVEWKDERMRILRKYAQVISPWNVGRYRDPETAKEHFAEHWPADLKFCRVFGKDYYAVVFPGFSWHNLKGAKLNQIPRLGGRFLWSQIEEVKNYKMNHAYVAMFDEVDEGTAIFKCTNNPPVGDFCDYEGLPSDHYLKLTGKAGRYLRGDQVKSPEWN